MFSIHPHDLQVRRKRCTQSVKALQKLVHLSRNTCNICRHHETVLLAGADRYGLQVRTVMCRNCGLIYLADRLGAETYSNFYADGSYRDLTAKFSGQTSHLRVLQEDQLRYATRVISTLEEYHDIPSHRLLLDVGGSAGLVASAVSSRFGCAGTVLDPSVEEVATAESNGLEGVVGSLETYQTDKTFDIILLCRSIEHLFDLRSSLLNIRKLLSPNGVFYCDIVDFPETCRTGGGPEAISKIDHCYWLSQETAPIIFASVGFEIVSMDVGSQSETVGFLLRPCLPSTSIQTPRIVIDALIRRLREVNADWRLCGATPRGLADRLRRTSYRTKRRMIRLADALGISLEDANTVPAPEWRTLDPAANLTIPHRSGQPGS